MDWWLVLLIFILLVLLVWWLLSRQTEEKAPTEKAQTSEADDLTKIEGIGPKVQGLLNEAGIFTFAQLAGKTHEELDAILDAAGSIYKAMDETSWPRQAKLAADGKWEELDKLQDELVGGR
ncbi:MAG: hypothetical protein JW757_00535 [Anaerolineales bacterium]|nr:hypothetical protein [Anaerolineales bacterium]